ncbi:hypothetical protein LissoIVSPER_00041 [Lissonota sp. PSUC_FEM 10030012]|nr:hypothetical protein [Lissonota sp. PSUC_FEM 10030012]
MMVFLERWVQLCGLSGEENITIDALYWAVIFYFQKIMILPSICDMMGKFDFESLKDFVFHFGRKKTVYPKIIKTPSCGNMKHLLIGFFTFYANFNYRRYVVCPLIGEVVKRRLFTTQEELPEQMGPCMEGLRVVDEMKSFEIDSGMCLQHPFAVTKNLTESMNEVSLYRFRTFCMKSLDVLNGESSQ